MFLIKKVMAIIFVMENGGSLVFARGKICCILYKTQVKLCKDVVSAAQEDSSPNL